MKKNLLFAVFIISLMPTAFQLKAQCSFTPVITPDNLILCPDAVDSLTTTEAFDTYQWYQNNKLIAGATNRYYKVNSYNDAATYFKVTVTRSGCTATSEKVLVDGWAFAPPIIISSGDVGIYDPNRGATIECPNDTLILTYGLPYNQNVQWYDNYKPITGANQQSYWATANGSFTVCGSPEVCPDFTQCELIPVDVLFSKISASITQSNDTLYASQARYYQWYFNGKKIPNANNNFIRPRQKGTYAVMTSDKYTCTALSVPFVITVDKPAIDEIITAAPNPVKDFLHVTLKTAGSFRLIISDFYGNRYADVKLFDSQNISLQQLHTGTYLLQLLNDQQELIGTKKIFKE